MHKYLSMSGIYTIKRIFVGYPFFTGSIAPLLKQKYSYTVPPPTRCPTSLALTIVNDYCTADTSFATVQDQNPELVPDVYQYNPVRLV